MSGRFGTNVAMVSAVMNVVGNATVESQWIDKRQMRNPESGKLFLNSGAYTGTPTSVGVVVKLQDSGDGGGTWNDVVDKVTGSVVGLPNTGQSSAAYTNSVDLAACRGMIKVVATVSFTGGTSPAIPISFGMLIGDTDVQPIS